MRVSRFENQLIVRLICGKVNHNADGFDLALHSVGRVESPLVFLYAASGPPSRKLRQAAKGLLKLKRPELLFEDGLGEYGKHFIENRSDLIAYLPQFTLSGV